ncbi:FAD binding domain-containing protein [Burkholderia sp. PAMC 26561]|uniref:FAD binding domain-containing protein n=1 Tax=Burkholderia sp. PAMC 26561 TaxID=1795043 RepID=UPI00084D7E00|nr:xanthine dehydrogenase family protein subunit M [Burkholderia sp. PAMC 26561]
MQPFEYVCATDEATAIEQVASDHTASFIAGGTTMVDLMKEQVFRPSRLVDISRLPMYEIAELPGGTLQIGANAKNAVVANHPLVRSRFPGLSEAISAGASRQIRSMASVAGNILQRTRCPYLRDVHQPCNKRSPGSGCSAIIGFNRLHAILGHTDDGPTGSHSCIATYPSDMAVMLAALDAVVVTRSRVGEERFLINDLLRLPANEPGLDSNLPHGSLIIAIELPMFGGISHYLKVRDRASYAFALVSCAVAIDLHDGRIDHVKIALGGLAHKPWRAREAEEMLSGHIPSDELFRSAAQLALTGAKYFSQNNFKGPMAIELIARGLLEAAGLEPLSGPAGSVFAANIGGVAANHVQ